MAILITVYMSQRLDMTFQARQGAQGHKTIC
ncbi:hypothetical protein AmaxDRAFT_1104 [Limnospira maxima CS-328]|nr:hypothetical protein AmaxDRAFT_1104 [Limnospira maxima CS-328]